MRGWKAAGLSFKILDEHVGTASGHVSISTIHLAKGLEFRAVVVMACDDESFPYRSGSKRSATMRIYRRSMRQSGTCCTSLARALGINLLVSGVDPVSEFLDDFAKGARAAEAAR